MKRVVIENVVKGEAITSDSLNKGEVMIIEDAVNRKYNGNIVMCGEESLFSLNDGGEWFGGADLRGYLLTSFAMQYYLEQTKEVKNG